MKQVVQNIRNGQINVEEIPAPATQPGTVLIANRASLISAGTEKSINDLAKKSLIGKARARPDHVKRVMEKVRNEGLRNTVVAVTQKLGEPMGLGYSSAGVVLACGDGVEKFKPGQKVVSNGPHAGVVCVPQNLCAALPESVPFEQGAFSVVGSIALQGVRLSKIALGESALVIGLGLIGQITVSLLKAAGVYVVGTDLNPQRCLLAGQMGADVASPNLSAAQCIELSHGLGFDSVLVTAGTSSNAPVALAANAVRKKGRVTVVGAVGMELNRQPFFEKEIEFAVSCSYGPGRYDSNYEERGLDYPPAYVRWTEQRNIQAVADMIGRGLLKVDPLVTHRFPIDDASSAYELIQSDTPHIGIVLSYDEIEGLPKSTIGLRSPAPSIGKPRYGVLGAGNFARMVMLPALQSESAATPVAICSAKGLSGHQAAKQRGFERSTTDEDDIFGDKTINTVVSLTRHDRHAGHVLKAINGGKNIFVEKPLCLNFEELKDIENSLRESTTPPILTVGFNRRFADFSRKAKEHFATVSSPLTISIRFNAGDLPKDHWIQNPQEGGGRIIGEACHAIDLAAYLAGSPPVRVYAESVGRNPASGSDHVTDDQSTLVIRHENGCLSTICYFAGGDKSFPKERVEVFGGGRVAVIDDFRRLQLTARGKTTEEKASQDKGHKAEVRAFFNAISKGGPWPISWKELRSVTMASFYAVRSLREGTAFDIPLDSIPKVESKRDR